MSFGPGGNRRSLPSTAAQKQRDAGLAAKAQQRRHFKTTLLTEQPPPFSASGLQRSWARFQHIPSCSCQWSRNTVSSIISRTGPVRFLPADITPALCPYNTRRISDKTQIWCCLKMKKKVGLRQHEGKPQLCLKTRLRRLSRITEERGDSYPLWTHRMLTGLRFGAGNSSNNMIQITIINTFLLKEKSDGQSLDW